MLPAMERSESVNLGDTLETPDFEDVDSLPDCAETPQRVPSIPWTIRGHASISVPQGSAVAAGP